MLLYDWNSRSENDGFIWYDNEQIIKGDKYCKTSGIAIGKMNDLIKEIDGSSSMKPSLVAALYHYHIKPIF